MKQDQTLHMLKQLTDAKAIAGDEGEARKVMQSYMKSTTDRIYTDHLGSLIGEKVGEENGPKIMIAGHLDEVGFMVTRIDKNGFLYFQPIGGWWNQVMLAQRVTIMTNKGNLTGVIGSKPPHILTAAERNKPVQIKDMFIDIGASTKEEAERFGVRPGDSVVPYFEFTQMKDEKMLLAKAWDNRIGCAIAIEVLNRLQKEKHPNIVYGVGTVQEEVGLRGAKTAAHLIEPDLAFAVDVGIAGDTPGVSEKDADSKLGEGPQLVLYDASMISHKGLRDLAVETAEECKIPFQYTSMPGGGTDGGSIHLNADGVPTLTVTIATRYIHSHAAMIHRDDFEHAVSLLVAMIKKIDKDMLHTLRRS